MADQTTKITVKLQEQRVVVTQFLSIDQLRQMLLQSERDGMKTIALEIGISLEDWHLTAAKVTVEVITRAQEMRKELANRKIVSPYNQHGIIDINKR